MAVHRTTPSVAQDPAFPGVESFSRPFTNITSATITTTAADSPSPQALSTRPTNVPTSADVHSSSRRIPHGPTTFRAAGDHLATTSQPRQPIHGKAWSISKCPPARPALHQSRPRQSSAPPQQPTRQPLASARPLPARPRQHTHLHAPYRCPAVCHFASTIGDSARTSYLAA